MIVDFSVRPAAIAGLVVLTMKQVTDDRGTVREFFRRSAFEAAGVSGLGPFQQVNITETRLGGLRGLHADRLFLGVDGLDPEIGLMTPDVVEAQLNAVMIQVSREVVVVADTSKFQRRSLSVIAKLDAVHKVITDSGANPEVVQALRARNIEVIVV